MGKADAQLVTARAEAPTHPLAPFPKSVDFVVQDAGSFRPSRPYHRSSAVAGSSQLRHHLTDSGTVSLELALQCP